MPMGARQAHEVLLLKSVVIAREQRDRSNRGVLQDKHGGIATHPSGARNDGLSEEEHDRSILA